MNCFGNQTYDIDQVTIIEIPKDGNCMFEAVRCQLNNVNYPDVASLRNVIVNKIYHTIALSENGAYVYNLVNNINITWIPIVEKHQRMCSNNLLAQQKHATNFVRNFNLQNDCKTAISHSKKILAGFDKIDKTLPAYPNHNSLVIASQQLATIQSNPDIGIDITNNVKELITIYLKYMRHDARTTHQSNSLYWGGEFELSAIATLFNLTIKTLEPANPNRYNISCIGNGSKIVYIIYDNNHYNAARIKCDLRVLQLPMPNSYSNPQIS